MAETNRDPVRSNIDGEDPQGVGEGTATEQRIAVGEGHDRGRLIYTDRNLTEGSIPKNLFALAWPQMITGLLQAVQQMADLIWAGFIGSRAIASIAVAQSWTMLFMTARMGLDTAGRAMISRAWGAGDRTLANHIAVQSITLSFTISFTLTSLGFIFTEALLRLLGVSEEVIAQGATYMRIQFVASFWMALQFSSAAVLQASGDAVTPMKSQLFARTSQIIVSPLLIFGLLGLPKLGLPVHLWLPR